MNLNSLGQALLAGVVTLGLPLPAHAWGEKGHKVVAEIAVPHLSAAAKESLQALIGDRRGPLMNAAIWSDQVGHDRPETWSWHQIDVPYAAGVFDPTGRCPNDNCILPRIDEFSRKLADKALPVEQRAEALRWVIHLVGEVHQPLHTINDDDDWGEEVWVRVGEETTKLHALWDTGLVNSLGRSPREIAAKIVAQITDGNLRDWRAGTASDWARESYAIGRDFIYAQSRGINSQETAIPLPDTYVIAAAPLVARRLAMAGIRLAWTLNRALE